jgi:hypothetical protein
MMFPKKVFVLEKNNQFLGNVSNNGSCVFAFTKKPDANKVQAFIQYKASEISKSKSNTYIVKPVARTQISKINLESIDTFEFMIQTSLHNLKLELIDNVELKKNNMILYSNYDIPTDIDNELLIENLNVMYYTQDVSSMFDINDFIDEDF